MDDVIGRLATADVTGHAEKVRLAAVLQVQVQADELVASLRAGGGTGAGSDPGRPWALACLRIALAAGMDGVEDVILLRRSGATWAEIGAAAGITRQSAHERWNTRVTGVLDRYGLGEPGGPVADDAP